MPINLDTLVFTDLLCQTASSYDGADLNNSKDNDDNAHDESGVLDSVVDGLTTTLEQEVKQLTGIDDESCNR